MPSSLIFAALAAAWLVVLVPMFARRRQEVSKTTDSALAARVVRRGSDRRPARSGAARTDHQVEEYGMPDTELDHADVDAELDAEQAQEDADWRPVHSEDARAGRRYRPGRGGYDPEAAALAARAKYARRQRIVLTMLLLAVTTAIFAALVAPVLWWAHAVVDLSLVGYLTYLRRQVRIEQDIRARRLARLNGEREHEDDYEYDEYPEEQEYEELDEPDREERPGELDEHEDDYDFDAEFDIEPEAHLDRGVSAEARAADIRPAVQRGVRVEIDDEDPVFDELDERTWEPYRRAAGE
ncbi:gephyrin-like molybdotransferase receptor GlpR [Saccharopolyspora griseoalba]|uniref:Gephyrin-like molybdotransferase receptor GlpR n=1 Tax=Saccharopolyspora griseoalba TaxID=1431848 RepID=A0ABW2LJ08_9PSEU